MKYSLRLLLVISLVFLCACSKPFERPQSVRSVPVISEKPFSAQAPQTFAQAKAAAWKIFEHHPITFYCGCHFNSEGEIQRESCSYNPTAFNQRTFRVEWEHIVPAKRLGENLACWQEKICVDSAGKSYKGRACCAKQSELFRYREADLHNLVPALGPLNQARGTLSFGQVSGSTPNFMGCPLKIDRKTGLVDPPIAIRGTIARAYLYMRDQYGIHLSLDETRQYTQWHQQYPPDAWEIRWNHLVQAVQGNYNPYIGNS